jgi:hypothetical protein
LGRAVAVALPVGSLAVAGVVGVTAGLGSALLVLASGVLLGAIGLVWASVRTLSGDAPLAADLAAVVLPDGTGAEVDLDEEKRRILRAIKDLEGEHALGRVDDADYELLVTRHREEAKAVMRRLDLQLSPAREEAERMARDYLERGALQGGVGKSSGPQAALRKDERLRCGSCGASNEQDAAFCKSCGGSMKQADTR